jgi:hypothetical protein
MNKVMKRMAESAPRGNVRRPIGEFRRLGAIVETTASNSTKPGAKRPSKVPCMAKAELAELTEAMLEHEMTKGDWSKGR